jgi:oxygen-independent coproporphyrinogen-3 oxidase
MIFEETLIKKYQKGLPRYTSYPTANRFNKSFKHKIQKIELEKILKYKSISLYIHIPFCNTLCLFCSCNKIITNKRDKIDVYLDYIEKELKIYQQIWGEKVLLDNIHFGGGSPSWMTVGQLKRMMLILDDFFILNSDINIAMEIDPRRVEFEFIETLVNHRFNRFSFGVQDVNNKVQKIINRVQPIEQTTKVIGWARDFGIDSINIDLIYGLPLQTVESYKYTINTVINDIKPSRIALYNYAHLPNIFNAQKKLDGLLPSGDEKLKILNMCVNELTKAGYIYIGMDHFALPQDELTTALTNKTLKRNFQGYSVENQENIIAIGVSGISSTPSSYWQNLKTIEEYYHSLDQGILPLNIGYSLSNEDILRKDIIHTLMGSFFLEFEQFNNKYQINFTELFSKELNQLKSLEIDGLLKIDNDKIEISILGRFLIRNIVAVFDQYLDEEKRFSSSI